MTKLSLPALAALAALALGACGGSDKPSREEFAKSAEKVCADLKKQSERLSTSEPDNVGEIAQFARDARKTAEDAVKKVRALELPEGEAGEKAGQWQDAVESEAEEKLIPALQKLEKAADANDEQALVAAAQELQGLESTESDRLAREIGAEGCAD
jgi:cytochrome c556